MKWIRYPFWGVRSNRAEGSQRFLFNLWRWRGCLLPSRYFIVHFFLSSWSLDLREWVLRRRLCFASSCWRSHCLWSKAEQRSTGRSGNAWYRCGDVLLRRCTPPCRPLDSSRQTFLALKDYLWWILSAQVLPQNLSSDFFRLIHLFCKLANLYHHMLASLFCKTLLRLKYGICQFVPIH